MLPPMRNVECWMLAWLLDGGCDEDANAVKYVHSNEYDNLEELFHLL